MADLIDYSLIMVRVFANQVNGLAVNTSGQLI